VNSINFNKSGCQLPSGKKRTIVRRKPIHHAVAKKPFSQAKRTVREGILVSCAGSFGFAL
jgi:hypothetical protein